MNSVKTKIIENLEKKIEILDTQLSTTQRIEKKKKRGGGGGGRKYIYDPYTNEMVRKTRCIT